MIGGVNNYPCLGDYMLVLQSYVDGLAKELKSGAVADATAFGLAKTAFLSKVSRLTMEAI